jgi:uncharacterized membrane protein
MKTSRPPIDVARFTSEEQSHEFDTCSVTHSVNGTAMDLNHRLSVQSASHSGPLPAPAVLAQYEKVCPGLLRTIVDLCKGQIRHRQEIETSLRQTDHEAMVRYYEGERRGQRYAILAIFGVLAVAVLAIVLDRPAVGVTGLLMGGAATIWAMRRRSGGPDAMASLRPDRESGVESVSRPRE